MKKGFLRKLTAFSVAAVMAFSTTATVLANEARIINIHRIEGDNVELTRGARSSAPREGQRLAQGNVLTTGRDSSVYLSMDAESILKMNQQSQITISSAGNRLAISVQSGTALLNVGTQQEGQGTEVRIGNTGMVVRGTMFTASRLGGNGVIHMLSGAGEVNGELLQLGYTLLISRQADGDNISIHPIVVEELDLFTLQAIADNAEYLIAYGMATTELLEALPALKESAIIREGAAQAEVDRSLQAAIASINRIPGIVIDQIATSPESDVDCPWDDGSVAGGGAQPPVALPPGGGAAPPPSSPNPGPPPNEEPPTPPITQPIHIHYRGVGGSGGGRFVPGETVTLTAGAPPAHLSPLAVANHWTVISGGHLPITMYGATITFVMPNHPLHLTIHWIVP
ncbi:MAG: FecR family protein [Defluviitaleaceae bacterium]|nr:FecR family protein [Defluviitaleaceae bacterium]